MFSVGYVTKINYSTVQKLNMHSKTIQTIAVGRSAESNYLVFYQPLSQQTFTSKKICLDETLASGPDFAL